MRFQVRQRDVHSELSVIQAKDAAIHVTYSYFVPEGKSIKHVRFNEEWVKAGD